MYHLTPELRLVLEAMRRPSTSSIRAALLLGPPGCGKTAFTRYFADQVGGEYVYSLLHSWSDDQELFFGVDVAAVVSGDVDSVRQPGVLARAAEMSTKNTVVLCLDEVDKVQERTEYLLLDFLQSGRVPVRPGLQIQARIENLVVFATSNGERDLSDATMRRFRRVRMNPISRDVMVDIITASGIPRSVAVTTVKVADTEVSLQEIQNACHDMWQVAQSLDDCVIIASQWIRRDGKVARGEVAPIWGEIMAARKRKP